MTKGLRNANGLGHTYKVGNSYKTVIRRNGRVFTATASSQKDSQHNAMLKAEGLGSPVAKRQEENIRLDFFLLNWLENEHRHNIAHSTYLRYRSLSIHHINPSIGKIFIAELTSRHISECLGHMRLAGQSVRSMQQVRALLSICLSDAENLEYIPLNPVRKVKNPQGKSKSFTPLNIEEIKRLLDTFQGTFLSARLHIALLCGLRQGEALGLRWSDIDLDNGTLEVKLQMQIVNKQAVFTGLKTERSRRIIILTSDTVNALKNHHRTVRRMKEDSREEWNNLDLVFPSDNGNFRSPKTDYDQWQNALKLSGITPRRLHDARHSAATLMYSSGVGIETISRALGHSTSAITSRLYVHSAEEPLREAALLVQNILSL